MKQRLVEWLCCPHCREELQLTVNLEEAGEVQEGNLICSHCSCNYPILRSIPRFVDKETYAESFGRQWRWFDQTQMDDSESKESYETFYLKTGFLPYEMPGRLVLDVGCGMGRFLDVASRAGAEVVGMDLSLAVEAAFANLGHRENVHIVQADAFHPPFKDAVFDMIYSIGVLHHTPDTHGAFQQLPRLLKKGGLFALWVYSRPSFAKVSNFYRKITTRLPRRLLLILCWVAVPLYYLHRLPFFGRLTMMLLPTSIHPKTAWRVLNTFDWYSPKYQWFHTREEVMGWFREAGFENVTSLPFPVSVKGTKANNE